MSRKIYIDTNVYIDYFDGRVDKLRPLGEFAYTVLQRTFSCEFEIIISDLLLQELKYNGYQEQMLSLIKSLEESKKIIRIFITHKEKECARELLRERKSSYNDILHAILAKKSNAQFLITRNIKDFMDIEDIIIPVFPESLE